MHLSLLCIIYCYPAGWIVTLSMIYVTEFYQLLLDYIFKWCLWTLGRGMSMQVFYTCYTAQVGAGCQWCRKMSLLRQQLLLLWPYHIHGKDRLCKAFKAFRNMSHEHFISLCLTDQGENFTVHCNVCWNMWHRRHCLWFEGRGWLEWELVKVLGCTWKNTPWIFYWLSVSPWKDHPPNYFSVPHILHVSYICFFFYF